MRSKVAIITGASGGIGREAAIALKAQGWQVGIIGRSPGRTEALGRELDAPFYIADFSRLSEVAALARRLLADWPRIDVLTNNAGGMFPRHSKTDDGHETTYQVNHLSHFLLTRLLMDRLLDSQAAVINTSSMAHKSIGAFYRPSRPEEPLLGSAHLAYGNAKLANILFTRELHRRYQAQGLSAAAFHPGVVATAFARNTQSPMRLMYSAAISRLLGIKTPAQGADTLLFLAQGKPGLDWEPGHYFINRRPAPISAKAASAANARTLWEKSEADLRDYL